MALTRENGSIRRKTYPTATFSTSNVTYNDLQSNPELAQKSDMLKKVVRSNNCTAKCPFLQSDHLWAIYTSSAQASCFSSDWL